MPEEKLIYKYRLEFTKVNDLVWVSHLDMVRLFTRLFLRAGVPICFSEGFNPHPKMVFCVPLPLGVASVCELLDFSSFEDLDTDKLAASLSAAAPAGLGVLSVYRPDTKFTGCEYARYTFDVAGLTDDASRSAALGFFTLDSIIADKTTKDGVKQKEIRGAIGDFTVSEDGKVTALLSVRSDDFLGPELFFSAFAKYCEAQNLGKPEYTAISRTALVRKDGRELFR